MILRIGESDAFPFYSILFSRRYFYPTTYRPKHDSLHPCARDGAVGGQDYARRGLRSLFLFFGVLGGFPGQPALRLGCRAPGAVIGALLYRAERRVVLLFCLCACLWLGVQ